MPTLSASSILFFTLAFFHALYPLKFLFRLILFLHIAILLCAWLNLLQPSLTHKNKAFEIWTRWIRSVIAETRSKYTITLFCLTIFLFFYTTPGYSNTKIVTCSLYRSNEKLVRGCLPNNRFIMAITKNTSKLSFKRVAIDSSDSSSVENVSKNVGKSYKSRLQLNTINWTIEKM